MSDLRHVIVSAPRGSGGAYRQLGHVMRRLPKLRPGWHVEVFTSAEGLAALRSAGATAVEAHVIEPADHRGRLRWEVLGLPFACRRDPTALVYSAFGPVLNLTIAARTVWMARNIIPLLEPATWEVSRRDVPRLHVLRRVFAQEARRAAGVISVSHHARAKLSRLSDVPLDRIAVVPHGADDADACVTSRPDLAAVLDEPFVLHVGQPIPYRRTLDLIQAHGDLLERHPAGPKLALVGGARSEDRAYSNQCQAALEPLLSAGRAVVLGQLGRADVLAVTRRAHAIVYPSVHEDCPNVVLEALAAGRPLVCADIPATRELCGDAAVMVSDPRRSSLASAVERAVFDEGLRGQLSRRAASRAALYTWDRATELTVAALEQAHAQRAV